MRLCLPGKMAGEVPDYCLQVFGFFSLVAVGEIVSFAG